MTPTQTATANAELTPAENDLPNMISVDDHVMEPKELWQQQLPASLRSLMQSVMGQRLQCSVEVEEL